MSKLERLLNLTALLLEGSRPLTVEQIGRSIPGYPEDPASFRRAFERDKDDLRELGIPLHLVQLSATDATDIGYTIEPDEYYLDDPGLDPDELAALWLAAGAIRVDGAAADTTFRKLGGVPVDGGPEDGALAGIAEVTVAPHLDTVFRAVVERRVLSFAYRGEQRSLEPHHLGFERSRWYVVGLDRDRGARRVFRLDRFDGVPDAGEAGAFDPPDEKVTLRMEPWRYGDGEPVRAVVEVDEVVLNSMLSRVGRDALVSIAGADPATVAFEVKDHEAFRRFILGFGATVRVVEPPELVESIVSWVEDALR